MTAIQWRKKLSVGVEQIDNDHRELILYLNDLDAAIHEGTFNKYAVLRTLQKLIEYTKAHFDREEAIMKRVHYPEMEEHHQEHLKAVRDILQLSVEFMTRSDKAAAQHLYDFTADWLVNHIILSDTRLTPYCRGVWL